MPFVPPSSSLFLPHIARSYACTHVQFEKAISMQLGGLHSFFFLSRSPCNLPSNVCIHKFSAKICSYRVAIAEYRFIIPAALLWNFSFSLLKAKKSLHRINLLIANVNKNMQRFFLPVLIWFASALLWYLWSSFVVWRYVECTRHTRTQSDDRVHIVLLCWGETLKRDRKTDVILFII
jgi:hypothetical protein